MKENKMKKTLRSLALSVISLLLCFSMLLGSTFAWFTDEIESGKNVIQAGNLDIEMYWTKDLSSGTWINAEDEDAEPVFNYDKWEPGYTEVRYVKIKNAGSLAFKYALSIIPDGEVSKLADVIDVFYVENATANIGGRAELNALGAKGTLRDAINGSIPVNGAIVPTGKTAEGAYSGEVVIAIALKMRESAGNEYQNLSIGDTFSLKLTATQYSFEKDGYGSDYDKDAQWPGNVTVGNSASATVTTTDNKTDTATELLSSDGKISASVALAPMKAKSGMKRCGDGQKARQRMQAKPAPALTPIVPGLASGFESTLCKSVPDSARPAPAISAPSVRGRRT